MNRPLLNRDFQIPADGYYQVVPKGRHPITISNAQAALFRNSKVAVSEDPDGFLYVIQVIDDAACQAIMNAFNAAKARPDFAGLLIDRDHFSDDPDQTSEAFGWIEELQNREDGIYMKPRWTPEGERKVREGAFRFPSPVFQPYNCEALSNSEIRPLVLTKAALTNEPNMRTIHPLSNSQKCAHMNPDGSFKGGFDGCVLHMQTCEGHSEESAKKICGSIAAAKNRSGGIPENQSPGTAGRKESSMDFKAELLGFLGLKADAPDTEIGAALANKKTEITTLTNRVADLEKKDLESQVDKDLDEHKDVIGNREDARAILLANRENGLKMLKAMKKPVAGPVVNRKDGKAPEEKGSDADKKADKAKAAKILNRCRELQKTTGKSRSRCWNAAQAEVESEETK
jgi:phage I-like protein